MIFFIWFGASARSMPVSYFVRYILMGQTLSVNLGHYASRGLAFITF